MSFTIPSVRFPVRWSSFNTIETCNPGLMFLRCVPFMISIHMVSIAGGMVGPLTTVETFFSMVRRDVSRTDVRAHALTFLILPLEFGLSQTHYKYVIYMGMATIF